MEQNARRDALRTILLIALALGAVASVAFTVGAGHRNPSYVLMAMFVVWVLSPYAMLGWLTTKPSAGRNRGILAAVILLLSFLPPVIYGAVALGPPRPNTAASFLMVPAASWLAIA